jgi:hypothetical protein
VLREPQRTMQLLMSALGGVIMLSICGLGGFFIIADERRGNGAAAAEISAAVLPPVPTRDITSRKADPRPLSTSEVFPGTEIHVPGAAAPYRVQSTHVDSDCHVATTGRLGELLDGYGCSQFVRATLSAPTDGYVVTTGIFNLADERGATAVHDRIKPLVDSGTGSFAGMAAGPGTEPVELPSAQVGWHVRGHYLVYCVIARPDGQIIRDDDPHAERILIDMIGSHLRDGVIGRRATAPV